MDIDKLLEKAKKANAGEIDLDLVLDLAKAVRELREQLRELTSHVLDL